MRLLFIVLFVGSCTFPTYPEEPELRPERQEGDVEKVCQRLRELDCKEGQATPEGHTCEEVLHNAAEQGIDLVGDVECTLQATSCKDARACE